MTNKDTVNKKLVSHVQEVLKIKDGYYQAGLHKVTFSMAGLSSGVYFYQLKTGEMKIVKKLTYVR